MKLFVVRRLSVILIGSGFRRHRLPDIECVISRVAAWVVELRTHLATRRTHPCILVLGQGYTAFPALATGSIKGEIPSAKNDPSAFFPKTFCHPPGLLCMARTRLSGACESESLFGLDEGLRTVFRASGSFCSWIIMTVRSAASVAMVCWCNEEKAFLFASKFSAE